jgi:hypothetical protein
MQDSRLWLDMRVEDGSAACAWGMGTSELDRGWGFMSSFNVNIEHPSYGRVMAAFIRYYSKKYT